MKTLILIGSVCCQRVRPLVILLTHVAKILFRTINNSNQCPAQLVLIEPFPLRFLRKKQRKKKQIACDEDKTGIAPKSAVFQYPLGTTSVESTRDLTKLYGRFRAGNGVNFETCSIKLHKGDCDC